MDEEENIQDEEGKRHKNAVMANKAVSVKTNRGANRVLDKDQHKISTQIELF